ncbi:matrix metalloproteinase-17 isoform X2 [Micropterus dolomieu]|uniref:matrix metalloproteinase-17 isoform X2 n=1 Tax=Micropterus dolomieu TaxID=147949 RepID=UPI001E8E05B0|nr:matrix metalloproteinase-17 isoform X2 [Micropterus dolomieu]
MVSLVHTWMRNMSEMMLLLPILWFLPLTGAAPSVTTEQLDTGVDWLSKFGYLPPPDPVTGQLQTKEALTKAIKAMQKFGGLKETGVFDQATLGLMKTPRCSLPDVSEAEVTMGRGKRSPAPPNKWNKRHLSWRVRTFPKDSALLGRDTVRALMYYALKVWSDIAPLNFHEVAGSDADIQIDFTKADHNDGYPFDGPGGTVAHAFFPGERFTAGDTHFDDDEAWTFRSPDSHGMDLFAVAVHEFGHAIGLVHTSAIESIMRPYYQGPVGDPLKYDLPYEDKVRVWQLYGVRDSVSHTNRPGNPSPTAEPPVLLDLPENRSTVLLARDAPDRCTSHFDAVAQIRGEAFFFKGKYFWRLTREKHLVSLRPAQIHRFWRGLPPNLDSVDAVYERPGDHKIVFFKAIDQLQLVQNSAARVLIRTRRKVHTLHTVLQSLHWLPLSFRTDLKIILLGYKSINGLAPNYLSDMVLRNVPTTSLRSYGNGLFLRSWLTPTVKKLLTTMAPACRKVCRRTWWEQSVE